jgi:DNA-binding response OmpR family regulator
MSCILVIDDDDLFREFLEAQLTAAGYEVIAACDGEDGLHKQAERPVDLVICDVLMPNKDGLETIRELRGRAPALPIISMTGGILADSEDGIDDLRMSLAFGATRSIGKPFRAVKLLKLVRECLESTRPDAAAEDPSGA